VFQKLISSKVHDHEGFYLLEAIVQYSELSVVAPYMKTVFTLIFSRLSRDKNNQKFLKSFIVFLSLFVGKFGPAPLIAHIDAVQPNLFLNVLDALWLPNVSKVTGTVERKMAAVALTKLLISHEMLSEKYLQQWIKALVSLLTLLELPEDGYAVSSEDFEDDEEGYEVVGLDASSGPYTPLMYAQKSNVDPFSEVSNLKQLVAVSLYQLFRDFPGKFPPLLDTTGGQANKILSQYFESAGLHGPHFV